MTLNSWLPDPFFRLYIKNMHRAKHGSDSEVYTKTGEYDNARFEETFRMYTKPPHTHIHWTEVLRMLHGNMDPFDFVSRFESVVVSLALTDGGR